MKRLRTIAVFAGMLACFAVGSAGAQRDLSGRDQPHPSFVGMLYEDLSRGPKK